jgi:hypothetical protein
MSIFSQPVTEIRLNNALGQLAADPLLGTTLTFLSDPGIPTLSEGQYVKVELDPFTTSYEITYLCYPYTAGDLVATNVLRGQEDEGWPPVPHPNGTWICAPTVLSFDVTFGEGTVTSVSADATLAITSDPTKTPTLSRAALIGDIAAAAGSNTTALQVTTNVETVVRASADPSQLQLMSGDLNMNSHRLQNLDMSNLGFGNAIFGDGSDGPIILDGTIVPSMMSFGFGFYTLNRDLYASSISMLAGIFLFPNGYRIFCTGTLTMAAGAEIFALGGAGGNTGTAGTNVTGGTLPGSSLGAAGGTSGGANGPTAGPTICNSVSGFNSGFGGHGSGSNVGGFGTSANAPKSEPRQLEALVNFSSRNAGASQQMYGGDGGAAGGGDGTNHGGGGGGGGGVIIVFARYIVATTSSINASGGAGGSPSAATVGSGGGGCGGFIGICSSSISSGAIAGLTLNVAGGAAPTGTRTSPATQGTAGNSGKTVLLIP